jgi:hypothetical protein
MKDSQQKECGGREKNNASGGNLSANTLLHRLSTLRTKNVLRRD